TEQDLAESQTDIEVDVLKVAHHGSAYSSTYQFLRAANPKHAVLSVGADNSYGHPTDEALSRLRDQGAHLYRTDLQGDVTITSDGKTIDVQTAKTLTGDVYAPNNTYEEAPPVTPSSKEASASQDGVAAAAPPASSADDAIVYKTNTGKKYHAGGCRYLSKSKIETTRGAAKAEGLTPCSVCNPG
ncbi:MAG: hypothetical protein LBU48_07920, partial [Coriobacteriales bacterium]|nr:hypothetical protein [Coriobacteriales bacterium]